METKPKETVEEALARVRKTFKPKAEPKHFVVTDADGHPLGFYSDVIHKDKIPPSAKPISAKQYRQWHEGHCANPMKRHRLVDGELVVHEETLTLGQRARVEIGAGLSINLATRKGLLSFPVHKRAVEAMLLMLKVMELKESAVESKVKPATKDPRYPMRDTKGVWVMLTRAEYLSVSSALLSYALALDLISDGNPFGVSELPPRIVTI